MMFQSFFKSHKSWHFRLQPTSSYFSETKLSPQARYFTASVSISAQIQDTGYILHQLRSVDSTVPGSVRCTLIIFLLPLPLSRFCADIQSVGYGNVVRYDETPHGVVRPHLEYWVHERYGPIRMSSEESHRNDQRYGVPLLWGKAEDLGQFFFKMSYNSSILFCNIFMTCQT